ncbi:hypothetical protein BDV41DRAFT_297641 [Aspergillus transmontanensis]|uniref:Uncharacterized protein n=1 Tax=Aspergillus transmontanensis TaxID=1034304 RepID=A0A5N6VWV3_9EURO|nr:hypothetical protein BDV41DRAFT_297641 [Aspergillus transmontanensis]
MPWCRYFGCCGCNLFCTYGLHILNAFDEILWTLLFILRQLRVVHDKRYIWFRF